MTHHKMPKLIRLYIKSCLIGFVAAAAFVGLMLWFDVMGLWGLVSRSEDGVLAVFVMWVLNGIVFGGVQFAYAIMSMAGTEPDDDAGNGPGGGLWQEAPVRVRRDER